MKPTFDVKCEKCNHVWEEQKYYKEPASSCPECGSAYTYTILSNLNTTKEFKPYDLLHRPIPDTTKTKSFPNDKRSKLK